MPRLQVRLLAALAASALAAGAVPATAQVYPLPAYPPPPPPMLAPHHAEAIVRSLGLAPASPVAMRGPVLVLYAVGQEGSPVEVTLDRYSGRVLRILRVGPGAPYVAVPPPPEADFGRYGEDDYDRDGGLPPPPASGPSVIERPQIRRGELAPPGAAPRAPAVTGSVPPDPLLGVPKEFRGQEARQRTAARPDPAPRRTPLPVPRPADAPAVAEQQSPAPPAPVPVPDVQGFE